MWWPGHSEVEEGKGLSTYSPKMMTKTNSDAVCSWVLFAAGKRSYNTWQCDIFNTGSKNQRPNNTGHLQDFSGHLQEACKKGDAHQDHHHIQHHTVAHPFRGEPHGFVCFRSWCPKVGEVKILNWICLVCVYINLFFWCSLCSLNKRLIICKSLLSRLETHSA